MPINPGTYQMYKPYPENTQINIKDFDGTETFIVVPDRDLVCAIKILKALGYTNHTDPMFYI